jgi:hypothetical protein
MVCVQLPTHVHAIQVIMILSVSIGIVTDTVKLEMKDAPITEPVHHLRFVLVIQDISILTVIIGCAVLTTVLIR